MLIMYSVDSDAIYESDKRRRRIGSGKVALQITELTNYFLESYLELPSPRPFLCLEQITEGIKWQNRVPARGVNEH